VLSEIENEIKILDYGFISPIFFFWIGYQTKLDYIFLAPLLTAAIFLVSNTAKILGTYFSTRNVLGRDSWVLGVGLCVRFSTSLVIIQMLLENGFIDSSLFSALVASAALSTVIIPLVFPYLLKKKKG
jgi:Kef-type K+ transport system membrane component KefB